MLKISHWFGFSLGYINIYITFLKLILLYNMNKIPWKKKAISPFFLLEIEDRIPRNYKLV